MRNKTKILSILAVFAYITCVSGTTAFAKMDAYLVKDKETGVVYQYDSKSLIQGFLNYAETKKDNFYEDFVSKVSKFGTYAYHDSTGKYVDFSAVSEAFLNCSENGQPFSLLTFTESKEAPVSTKIPKTVKKAVTKSGDISFLDEYTENSLADEEAMTEESSIKEKEFLQSIKEIDWDTEEILKKAQEITKDKTSDYEKSKTIYEWITDNVKYESYYPYVLKNEPWYHLTYASNVMKSKKSNCLGFANINAALHRAIGIEARVVDGWAYNPDFEDTWMNSEECRHAWNEVLIGEKWIIQDPTWDEDRRPMKYFDPDINDFEKDHRRDKVVY